VDGVKIKLPEGVSLFLSYNKTSNNLIIDLKIVFVEEETKQSQRLEEFSR
jgi:hypothetical protein